MRTYYSDYVKHCMRYYIAHQDGGHADDVAATNWRACDRALATFSSDERELLMEIYSYGGDMAEAIRYTRKNAKTVWRLITKLERLIAKERDLI